MPLFSAASPVSPVSNYLDVNLYGYEVGVISVQTGVHDFVHPVDHDSLDKADHLLSLLLGALRDQPVVQCGYRHRIRGTGGGFCPRAFGRSWYWLGRWSKVGEVEVRGNYVMNLRTARGVTAFSGHHPLCVIRDNKEGCLDLSNLLLAAGLSCHRHIDSHELST